MTGSSKDTVQRDVSTVSNETVGDTTISHNGSVRERKPKTKQSVANRREAIKELEAQGYSKNTEIANILGVTEKTVRRDKSNSANAEKPKTDQAQRTVNSANAEVTTLKAEVEKLKSVVSQI